MSREVVEDVSIAFQSNKRPADYVILAQGAEEYGFGTVSVFGDLMFQPPIAPLLVMAQATQRIRLGAAGMNPYTLHPVEIAGQVAALDAVSAGRAYAGLVAGAWMDRIGVSRTRPAQALRDTVAVVRRLLAGDDSGYDGDVFRLDPGVRLNYEVQRKQVPILIGGWGPRVVAVAGEWAEELKLGGSANPDLVAVAKERLRAGSAVRDVGIVLGAVTVVDEDGDAARARARAEVALYLPVVAALDPSVDVDPELLARMGRLVDEGRSDAAAQLVPQRLLDPFCFAGTPQEVADHALAVLDAGAARVEFGTPHGLTDAGGLRLLGERVLPALRGR